MRELQIEIIETGAKAWTPVPPSPGADSVDDAAKELCLKNNHELKGWCVRDYRGYRFFDHTSLDLEPHEASILEDYILRNGLGAEAFADEWGILSLVSYFDQAFWGEFDSKEHFAFEVHFNLDGELNTDTKENRRIVNNIRRKFDLAGMADDYFTEHDLIYLEPEPGYFFVFDSPTE